jgi:subtilisin family serine protease
MRLSGRPGLRLPVAAAVAGAMLVAVSVSTSGTAQAAPDSTALYVVQLSGAPLASYAGTERGYPATRPAAGRKLDAHSASAVAYGNHLRSRQAEVLRQAGVDAARVVYRYGTTLNGVAVRLTTAQVAKLQANSQVTRVWKNAIVSTDELTTPDFIGLTGRNGVWRQQFGGDRNAGLGIIVADLDTGFWPESPSFGALPLPRPDAATIAAKWHGTCDTTGERPVTCNNKVIGARYFDSAGLSNANPGEFTSPRDYDGHGSHTASTAAGNLVAHATNNGNDLGPVEGVAPATRLAIYKVLYENAANDRATGSTVDIAAAVDQAVADGVDVINMSLGGSGDAFSLIDVATLSATIAGVFVSMSAGNDGPAEATVGNDMPWETTAAAGTHDKLVSKTVTLGNGQSYSSVGSGPALASKPLVDAARVPAAGRTAADAALCLPGSINPAAVAGKVVLCNRGNNTRVDKGQTVRDAGGAGMVLANVDGGAGDVDADFHFVPSVHVAAAAGNAIRAYADTAASPTASMSAATYNTVRAPGVTEFSSRGPTQNSAGNLVKPDILAPGNDVIAGVSPQNHGGNLYDTESGTSMAAPHVTGVAALLLSKHPNWPPMWIKSAIMTTAQQRDTAGKAILDLATGAAATPLEMGSGQINPGGAFDPGLVYDSTPTQWLQFTCGIGIHLADGDGNDVCESTGSITPTDLNYPSIGIGALAGKQTVRRTVTNITRQYGIYLPQVKAPAGYKVAVQPAVLIVPPGRTAKYQVTITRTNAPLLAYGSGSLTWVELTGRHRVYSPISVRSVPLLTPAEVTGTGTSGSTPVSVTPGYTGTLTAKAYGLVPDQVASLSLTADPNDGFDPTAPTTSGHAGRVEVSVPAGTKLARFSTLDADYVVGTDVDLYVYAKAADGTLTLVGTSATGTAQEQVELTEPGNYSVFVDLFATPASGPVTVKQHTWTVGATNAGNVTATPASQAVTLAKPATVTLGWSALAAGSRYLGVIEYGDGTAVVGRTVLAVNP